MSASPQPALAVKGNSSRYHLTEPTVEIDGKMFGKGWLLISEEEYASLVASPPPSGTVEIERYAIQDLRAWGCKCHKPLLGWRHGQGPRCRICNAERPATADGWREP